ncbi:MAG: hypothetical protein JST86_07830 [Bacteroidetes bacterium]|nr:hypothetical protein [Bacteroidota bacterium]
MQQLKTICAILFISSLFSCKKQSDSCPDPQNIELFTYKPVAYEGTDLKIRAANTYAFATYNWTGPGGWTSHDIIPVRTNVQQQDGGLYSLEILNGGCTQYTGSLNIPVVPIPTPACNTTNNTINSNLPGVANFTFAPNEYVSMYAYGYSYYFTIVTASNDRIDIFFPSSNPPTPGLYNANTGITVPYPDNLATINIYQGGTRYVNYGSNNDVLVRIINGKYEISFCNLTMTNSYFNPTVQFQITGKITTT